MPSPAGIAPHRICQSCFLVNFPWKNSAPVSSWKPFFCPWVAQGAETSSHSTLCCEWQLPLSFLCWGCEIAGLHRCRWTFWLLPVWGFYRQCCQEHHYTCVLEHTCESNLRVSADQRACPCSTLPHHASMLTLIRSGENPTDCIRFRQMQFPALWGVWQRVTVETAHHCHQPARILASTAPLFQCKYLPAQSTPISTLHSSTTHRKDATSQFSDSLQFNKSYLRLYQTHDRHLSTGSSYFPHRKQARWSNARQNPGLQEGMCTRSLNILYQEGRKEVLTGIVLWEPLRERGGCQKHTRASLERGSNWSNYR